MANTIPTNGTGLQDTQSLRTGMPGAKEFVRDRVVEKLFDFPAIQNATGPADLLSHGTGTAALSEINSAEICGLTLDASGIVIL